MKKDIKEEVKIPAGVEIKIESRIVKAKGPKGEASKVLYAPKINIEVKDNNVVVSAKNATKREKRMIGSFASHIENLIQGVTKLHVYKLKICATHFPMSASVSKGEFVLQNFLGEKIPRAVKLRQGVNVKIEGAEITVESADKELAGQTAASIEQLCRITDRDRRVFQDGVYITAKSEKER